MQLCTINKLTIGGDAPVRLMGVINVSPESFYTDSFIATDSVHAKAVEMVEQGADIIDVGARSTAPNAQAIHGTVEAQRIEAALKELDGGGFTISVDTMNPWVLDACLKYDIHAVNDISGLSSPALLQRVADSGLPAFLMAANYQPGDAVGFDETVAALKTIESRCASAGIKNYVLDPGVGMWTPLRSTDDDWELCRRFEEFQSFGRPLLAAISRKSFIGALLDKFPEDRLAGSLAVTQFLLAKGASVVRTHDVGATRDVIRVYERMVKGA